MRPEQPGPASDQQPTAAQRCRGGCGQARAPEEAPMPAPRHARQADRRPHARHAVARVFSPDGRAARVPGRARRSLCPRPGPARSSWPSRALAPWERPACTGGEERWPAFVTRRPIVVSESHGGSWRLPRCACRPEPAARCEATRGRKGVARYPPLPPRSPGRPSAWTSGRRRDQPCSLPTNSVGRRVRRVDTPTARKAFPEASGQAQTPLPPRPRRPRPPNDTAGASTVYHQLTSPRVAPHAPQAAWPLAGHGRSPANP